MTTLLEITQNQAQSLFYSFKEKIKLNEILINDSAPDNYTAKINIDAISAPIPISPPSPLTTSTTTSTTTLISNSKIFITLKKIHITCEPILCEPNLCELFLMRTYIFWFT